MLVLFKLSQIIDKIFGSLFVVRLYVRCIWNLKLIQLYVEYVEDGKQCIRKSLSIHYYSIGQFISN